MGLFSSGSNASGATEYTQLQVNTSAYGQVLPVVYGQTRVGMNLIDQQGFKAVGQAGGKGKGGATTYVYYVDFLGAICEGPVDDPISIWANNNAPTTLAGAALEFENGYYGQAPWPYWQSHYPGNAVPYSGTAYVAGGGFPLGASATLPQLAFEIPGFFAGTAPNGVDADPSLVIPDILSNVHYGVGFPAARIGELQFTANTESHAVPGSGPYTVTVTNNAIYQYNLDVETAAGVALTCVAASPAMGQYSVNQSTGVYTFNSGDAGTTFYFNYAFIYSSLPTYQAWTLAMGLWISPAYNQQVQSGQAITDILLGTYADPVWSCGTLRFTPRSTVSVTGNGYTYTAATQPNYSLTDDDFLPNTNATGTVSASLNDDPVIVTRSRPSDQINDIKIEVLDRGNAYGATMVEATDMALIDQFGRRPNGSKQLHIFSDIPAANVSAQLQLQDQNIRNLYSITLDVRYCVIDVGDIIAVTDEYLNIAEQWVRVREVTENDDGTLSITSEEYIGGIGGVPQYSFESGKATNPNLNQPSAPINAPFFYPVPLPITSNGQNFQTGVALSGQNMATFGGAQVFIATKSTGPFSQLVPNFSGASIMGVTKSILGVTAASNQSVPLTIDLTESEGSLPSFADAAANTFQSLLMLRGTGGITSPYEIISYTTSTNTGGYTYSLGASSSSIYILRGLFDTAIQSWGVGTLAVAIAQDDNNYIIPYKQSDIGATFFGLFPSFNIFGGGLESQAAATVYSWIAQPTPIPLPPTNLQLSLVSNITQTNVPSGGSAGNPVVTTVLTAEWDASVSYYVINGGQYEIQFRVHGTSTWLEGGIVSYANLEFTIPSVVLGTAYDVQVRAIDAFGQFSDSSPPWQAIVSNFTISTNGSSAGRPSSLALASGGANLTIQPNGTIYAPIVASWTAPSDPLVTVGGVIQIQYKLHSSSTWLVGGQVPGNVTTFAILNCLVGGVYDVQIRSINSNGVYSDTTAPWTEIVTSYTVIGKITGPAAPSSIVATGQVLSIEGLTNSTTAAGNNTLHFASTPGGLSAGMLISDNTNVGSIAVGTTISSTTGTTVVMSAGAAAGVGSGDAILFTPAATGQGIMSVAVTWTNPADPTFDHVEIYVAQSTVNETFAYPGIPTIGQMAVDSFNVNIGSTLPGFVREVKTSLYLYDGPIYPVSALGASNTGQFTPVLYFWLRSVDSSGNKGAFAAPVSGFGTGQAAAFGNAVAAFAGNATPDAFVAPSGGFLASPVTGIGTAQLLFTFNVTNAQAGTLDISASLLQTYSSTAKPWTFSVTVDGTQGPIAFDLTGNNFQMSVTVSGSLTIAAGTHVVDVFWIGDATMTASAAQCAVEGIMSV